MKRIANYTLLLLFVVGLSSCINIRTEYPQLNFYKLTAEPSIISSDMKIDASVQIRDAEVADGIDTDHLFAIWDKDKMRKYYYHRWISDVSSLMTDFFRQRYSELNVFQRGVVNSSSAVIPNYFLELRLLQMDCYSSSDNPKDSSYVEVSILATALEYRPEIADTRSLIAKTFKTKIKRPDSEIQSIVPAYSKAFSDLTDIVFADFYTEIIVNTKNK